MCVLKRNSLVHVFSFFSRNSLNHMAFMVSKLEEEDSFSSCASLAQFFSKNYFTPHSHIDSFFLYFCQPPTTILALRSAYESFHIRRCGAGFGSLTGLAGMSRHCRMRNGQVHFWCQKWNSFYFFIVRFFQEVTVMGYSTMFLFGPGVETLFRSFGGLQLGGRKTSSLSCHLISYKLEGLVR